jgi:hypothetical protein
MKNDGLRLAAVAGGELLLGAAPYTPGTGCCLPLCDRGRWGWVLPPSPSRSPQEAPPAPAVPQREFTVAEVAKEGAGAARFLVILDDNVYDLTEFRRVHPGGEDVLWSVAGGPARFAVGSWLHCLPIKWVAAAVVVVGGGGRRLPPLGCCTSVHSPLLLR